MLYQVSSHSLPSSEHKDSILKKKENSFSSFFPFSNDEGIKVAKSRSYIGDFFKQKKKVSNGVERSLREQSDILIDNLQDVIISRAVKVNPRLEHSFHKVDKIILKNLNYNQSLLLAQEIYELILTKKLQVNVKMRLFLGDFLHRFTNPCVLHIEIDKNFSSILLDFKKKNILKLEVVYDKNSDSHPEGDGPEATNNLFENDVALDYSKSTETKLEDDNLLKKKKDSSRGIFTESNDSHSTRIAKRENGYHVVNSNYNLDPTLQITVMDSEEYNLNLKKTSKLDNISSHESIHNSLLEVCEKLKNVHDSGAHHVVKEPSDVGAILDLASNSKFNNYKNSNL